MCCAAFAPYLTAVLSNKGSKGCTRSSDPASLVQITIASLHNVFDSARGIMRWLSGAARAISTGHAKDMSMGSLNVTEIADVVRWTTPLGLPAEQHYRTFVSPPVFALVSAATLGSGHHHAWPTDCLPCSATAPLRALLSRM